MNNPFTSPVPPPISDYKDGPGGIYAGSMPPPVGSQQNYEGLNHYAQKGQIVLVGSSLMGQFPINELMMSQGLPGVVYNRAVGCNTREFLDNSPLMEQAIFALNPGKLFLNLGTRDLDLPGDSVGNLIANYQILLDIIQQRLPTCQIYIIAFYPIRRLRQDEQRPPNFRTRESLLETNRALEALCVQTGCRFVDMNHVLVDPDGYLREEFAADAIHLTVDAYYALLQELVRFF